MGTIGATTSTARTPTLYCQWTRLVTVPNPPATARSRAGTQRSPPGTIAEADTASDASSRSTSIAATWMLSAWRIPSIRSLGGWLMDLLRTAPWAASLRRGALAGDPRLGDGRRRRGHEAELLEELEAVEDEVLAGEPALLDGEDRDVAAAQAAAHRRDRPRGGAEDALVSAGEGPLLDDGRALGGHAVDAGADVGERRPPVGGEVADPVDPAVHGVARGHVLDVVGEELGEPRPVLRVERVVAAARDVACIQHHGTSLCGAV